MAKNDAVLLDGIVDELGGSNTPNDRGEVFERFVIGQLLKDLDLTEEEVEYGWVDGRNDGGIDGFYTFINGHLLTRTAEFLWPKTRADVEVVVITCKHHATFQEVVLSALLASLQELLDFGIEKAQLSGKYADRLLSSRDLLHIAYRRLAVLGLSLRMRVVYASRGDTSDIGQSVRTRSEQLVALISRLFSDAVVEFSFCGAAELVQIYRRSKTFSLVLPLAECLATGSDGYVLLTQLRDYCAFVTDEAGHLRRYLFDSNVRDYLANTVVNKDIEASLGAQSGPDFWWLNNGVTILATSARIVGKTIHLQDIQIVNGLQTTETIYQYFSRDKTATDERKLLVKVIVSTDVVVRDQIIRATNNQTLVEPSALHATDKIQRDIEEILARCGWFYERRRNYYRNIGKPTDRLVDPLFVAVGVVALILKNPARSAKVKARYLRSPEAYSIVYSEKLPIRIWPVLVDLLKRSEWALVQIREQGPSQARFLANWRGSLALLAFGRLIGTWEYSLQDLVEAPIHRFSQDLLLECWSVVTEVRPSAARGDGRPTGEFLKRTFAVAAERFGIRGLETVGRRDIPISPAAAASAQTVSFAISDLPDGLVDAVDAALPAQPWKPRVHADVARELAVRPVLVQRAIKILIATGRRFEQIDGRVFDLSGNVVAVDAERVKASAGQ